MIISIIILAAVFFLIVIRQIGNMKFQIWQIMLGGAIAVLVTAQISPIEAFKSINLDIVLFLFGMFVVGGALEKSGYLSYLSYKFFRRAKSFDQLILFVLFGAGFASALLMNDTIAIIGTSLVLFLAKKNSLPPKILLLALAFAVTIGSVFSPIGNPQNLLITINGAVENPFINFFKFLFTPTIINLFFVYLLLKIFYNGQLTKRLENNSEEQIKDFNLAFLSKISIAILLSLIIIKIFLIYLFPSFNFRLTYIALISASPILLFGKDKIKIIKEVDWHTLIFFVAMFILMQSVWNSGFFQSMINRLDMNLTSILVIFLVSIVLSQLISNVPLVALYIPILINSGASAKEMIALAAGSTIAGNLFILGAASNIIIIQNAEEKYGETITFLEFARIGIPLTIINILIYYLFFYIL
jgi:Na+/H+ antiporter NhaD/arsenite permease-like protein